MAGGFLKELRAAASRSRSRRRIRRRHAVQTAKVMIAFEEICLADRPDLVVVVGDVNSTMAASLVAAKLVIPIAHVEAGLRSFDRDDAGRDQPDRHRSARRSAADAVARRQREPSARKARPPEKIHLVGNVMIDTLRRHLPLATLERDPRPRAGRRRARTRC